MLSFLSCFSPATNGYKLSELCLLLNQWGCIVACACATANVADNTFQGLIRQCEERMIVLSDTAFHAAEGDPSNLKLCQRGE
jgi:hypothetical protein